MSQIIVDLLQVDLIVCYDVSKSPIRLVQRMGRTGRKREGKIIVLVTEVRLKKLPFLFVLKNVHNSGPRSQKLKIKKFLSKTQAFFVQKLKKSEILAEKSKFPMKMEVFDEIS